MELGIMLIMLLVLVSGFLIGVIVERFRSGKGETQGVVYVYCGESENKPSLLLEYYVPIEDITSRKQVVFDVDVIR